MDCADPGLSEVLVEVDFDVAHLALGIVAFFEDVVGLIDDLGPQADFDAGIELHDGFHEFSGLGDVAF